MTTYTKEQIAKMSDEEVEQALDQRWKELTSGMGPGNISLFGELLFCIVPIVAVVIFILITIL